MIMGGGGVIVFNATFNDISVISWWSVLLVEETGVPGETHRPGGHEIFSLQLTVKKPNLIYTYAFIITDFIIIGLYCIS